MKASAEEVAVIDFGLPRRRWKTEDHEGWNHTGADIALPTGVLIGSRISGCLIPAGLDGAPGVVFEQLRAAPNT
jgi:hypothetical protein